MSKNKSWELLNKNKLPRFESGSHKNKINSEACVGMTLIFKNINSSQIYEIKIIEYIQGYRENGKNIVPKFKVVYVYLKGTEYEEVISKSIDCNSLINGANIGGIIPSLNQWRKENDYWISIITKGEEFKFDTDDKELEYDILHSTWNIVNNDKPYIKTNKLYNRGSKNWTLHKAIAYNGDEKMAQENSNMCIDHLNGDSLDNRKENLEIKTIQENNKNKKTKNKLGLTGLKQTKNGKYYSHFNYNNKPINTKHRESLDEAKIDNLIVQKYLGYAHNSEQFDLLDNIDEARIKEVEDLIEEGKKKIDCQKDKEKQKEYKYDFIEKDGLIGIRTFKKDGTENPICWVDKDFGEIRGDKYIVNGMIWKDRKYFRYTINGKQYRIHIYITTRGISLQSYKEYIFHIDHVNHNPNDNYGDNLEIVTHYSNQYNKESKGYYEIKSNKYCVKFGIKWKYFNLYIKDTIEQPTVYTIKEAEEIVKRRRDIINKYRFRVKTLEELDEVIDFAEEYELDLDSAYIVWRGLDSLENIKNFLKPIDK